MKRTLPLIALAILVLASCTSQKKLAYLNNLPEPGGEGTFTMEIPDYNIQPRDVLYITIKAMTPDGKISDFLTATNAYMSGASSQGDGSGFIYGYDVSSEGNINLPAVGSINVKELTLEEAKKLIQSRADKIFNNSTVDCRLLSFKYTVIGEAKIPGTYINYNNYLTVFEAIGRAGGISDYGNRNRIMVVRPIDKGTKTYRLNLQDKNIITSEAYFLLPNDVVIVEPSKQKIFNQNLPTFSFFLTITLSTISTTLLLINYFGN